MIEKKGKEILQEAKFDEFRQALIDSLMKKISIEGRCGADIRPIIEETLKEEFFVDFVKNLAKIIERRTRMKKEDINKTAYRLVEEDVVEDIKNILQGQMEEKEEKSKKDIGKEHHLWGETKVRLLGKKPKLKDIAMLFKEHYIMKYTIIIGAIMLIISAILFGSIYKAIAVGLTLTIFQGNSIHIKIANVLGGLGGILIFFTSLSILIEYIMLTERRSRQIQELAKKYFERK